MNKGITPLKNNESMWHEFARQEKINEQQANAFKQYMDLLIAWNQDINLTTIVNPEDIIAYHFKDSLILDKYIDLTSYKTMVDVGTGGGFPGIPLAIKYPQLSCILLEVNKKKLSFLATVLQELNLENVVVYDIDWRTFLRKTQFPADLFLSRASLHTDELIRMFKPSCFYNTASLVYWASKDWHIASKEEPFLQKEVAYTMKNKTRKLVFFAKPIDQKS